MLLWKDTVGDVVAVILSMCRRSYGGYVSPLSWRLAITRYVLLVTIGWEEIGHLLTGKPERQDGLFEKTEEPPSWATVDINRVSIGRLRSFGDIYLALLLWHRLGFSDFCKEHIPEGREAIPWSVMACILSVARFCAPSSELQIAEFWYDKTALDDLLGVPADRVNDDRLYRSLDALCLIKTPCAGIYRTAMENSLERLSTFSFMISPPHILKV